MSQARGLGSSRQPQDPPAQAAWGVLLPDGSWRRAERLSFGALGSSCKAHVVPGAAEPSPCGRPGWTPMTGPGSQRLLPRWCPLPLRGLEGFRLSLSWSRPLPHGRSGNLSPDCWFPTCDIRAQSGPSGAWLGGRTLGPTGSLSQAQPRVPDAENLGHELRGRRRGGRRPFHCHSRIGPATLWDPRRVRAHTKSDAMQRQEVSRGPMMVVGALLGTRRSSGDAPLKSILSWGQPIL